MPKKKKQTKEANPTAELLKDLLIVELAKARVPQPKIRTIVRCDMWRVNRIAKYFKKKATGTAKA
jgi:hypothetical protein